MKTALMIAVASLLLTAFAPVASAGPLNCGPEPWPDGPPPGWTTACMTVNAVADAPQPLLDGFERVRDCLGSRSPLDWSPNFVIGCALQV